MKHTKKTLILLLALVLVLALAACNGTSTPVSPNDDIETDNGVDSGHTGGTALGITIESIYGQGGPADVSVSHTFDYSVHMHAADIPGDTLMIRTFTTLHNFSVIVMENDNDEDYGVIFTPVGIYGTVETFEPSEAYIITAFLSAGTLPQSGITFTDEAGQNWYFAIMQNQADEGDPYFFILLEYEAGFLRFSAS